MCMFMAEADVQGTDIFATQHGGRQVLVYGAKVSTDVENAMVLPIPVASRATPVELLDLSAYSMFFSTLERYYFPPAAEGDGP